MTLKAKVEALLVSRPVSPQRAHVSSDFAAQCMALLLLAHQRFTQEPAWSAFLGKSGTWTSAKRKAVKAVPQQKARKPRSPRLDERAITTELATHSMQLVRTSQHKPLSAATAVGAVVADVPQAGKAKTGIRSNRPDLIFYPSPPELAFEFAVEAKVIERSADVTKELLGPTGLECFTRKDDPYVSNGVFGLIGYAESSKAQGFLTEIGTCATTGAQLVGAEQSQLPCSWGGQTVDGAFVVGKTASGDEHVCVSSTLSMPVLRSPKQL